MIQDHELPILVIRQAADRLRREEWGFLVMIRDNRLELVLNSYADFRRPGRKQYDLSRVVAGWGRMTDITHNLRGGRLLPDWEVPVPQDVWDEAMGKLIAGVGRFGPGEWKRYKS